MSSNGFNYGSANFVLYGETSILKNTGNIVSNGDKAVIIQNKGTVYSENDYLIVNGNGGIVRKI